MAPSILVVGDIHRSWRPEDALYLESGDQDLTLFVGDLGDEDVPMVRAVSEVNAPKAVILGNHDAWRSFSEKHVTKPLRESLDLIGSDHLAYGVREWPQAGLSIIGARPFSWGGADIRSPEVYSELYGVGSHEESAARIVDAARRAQHRDIMILAHNGPTGLSQESNDIWGKDFGKSKRPRGDWGDRDLELAIAQIKGLGYRIPCVVAGHMHHRLLYPRGALRTRFLRRNRTLYVNAAVVPRLRKHENGSRLAHFLRITCSSGQVDSLEEEWVNANGKKVAVDQPRILEQES